MRKARQFICCCINEGSGNTVEDNVKFAVINSGRIKSGIMTMYSEYEKNGVKIAESLF